MVGHRDPAGTSAGGSTPAADHREGRSVGLPDTEISVESPDAEAAYQSAVAALPDHVRLVLRDRMRGLEAEAGSARALAGRVQREWAADSQRLNLVTVQLRSELEAAETAGTAATAERDAAAAERDTAVGQRDTALIERDAAVAERDAALVDRQRVEQALAELRAELSAVRERLDRLDQAVFRGSGAGRPRPRWWRG